MLGGHQPETQLVVTVEDERRRHGDDHEQDEDNEAGDGAAVLREVAPELGERARAGCLGRRGDRGPAFGSFTNKINTTNLSWLIVSQGRCGPCAFSPTHYCAQQLAADPDCGRLYAGGFYVCYDQGAVHDQFWTEYGCVVATPERLIVRDTAGAIVCLVSGNPQSGGTASTGAAATTITDAASRTIPAAASAPEEPVTVEGELRYVFNNGKAVLLAFAEPHRGHFKALIPREAWPQFPGLGTAMGRDRAGLWREGDRVRVTGRLTWYQGDQAVVVTSPGQLTKAAPELTGFGALAADGRLELRP